MQLLFPPAKRPPSRLGFNSLNAISLEERKVMIRAMYAAGCKHKAGMVKYFFQGQPRSLCFVCKTDKLSDGSGPVYGQFCRRWVDVIVLSVVLLGFMDVVGSIISCSLLKKKTFSWCFLFCPFLSAIRISINANIHCFLESWLILHAPI